MSEVLAEAPVTVTESQQRDIYRMAFTQVCDPVNWAGPIDCLVPWDLVNLYVQAIEFVTHLRPTYSKEGNMARLKCAGYLMSPKGYQDGDFH